MTIYPISAMKETILTTIYEEFALWAAGESFSCGAGCATCCTKNVTITSLEGKRILGQIVQTGRADHLIAFLNEAEINKPPFHTTNEFILHSLEGKESPDNVDISGVCPFLADNLCTIYPVRPFSCRCFASTIVCSDQKSASVPDHYLYGSMAGMQLVEHLDQFNSWGIMTDMLLALSHSKQFHATFENLIPADKAISARTALRTAQPLPGFILPAPFQKAIEPLLQSIFSAQIDHRTIEQIFNGQQ